MSRKWEPNTLGRCLSLFRPGRQIPLGACLLPVLVSVGLLLSAKPKKHPVKPPPHPKPKVVGAAGLIAVAQHELDLNNPSAAAEYAKAASSKAPMLDDYAQYIRAQAEYLLKNYAEVAKSATRVFNQSPPSPLIGDAATIAVRAELDHDSPKSALDLIRKYYDRIPQPQGDLLLARGLQSSGDLAQAAEYYERVYYNYPAAKEATDAANALVDVKQQLGEAFPVPMPAALLNRAQKLFDAKNPAAARIELAAAIPQLGGSQRDLARVRLGEADFLAGHTSPGISILHRPQSGRRRSRCREARLSHPLYTQIGPPRRRTAVPRPAREESPKLSLAHGRSYLYSRSS